MSAVERWRERITRLGLLLLGGGLAVACGGKSVAPTDARGRSESDAGTVAPAREPAPKGLLDAGGLAPGVMPDASEPGGDARNDPTGEASPGAPEGSTPNPGPDDPPVLSAVPVSTEPTVPIAPTVPAAPRVAACGATELPTAESQHVAEALAFSLWGEPMDDELLRSAESGALDTAEGLEAQIRRMIEDERGQAHLAAFGRWWLGASWGDDWVPLKDPDRFPEFDSALFDSMRRETDLFMKSLVADESATLGTLLGADYTFVDAALGALYGLDAAGNDFQRVALDPDVRSGLFTQPLFLTATTKDQTDPIRRGFFLRERLLCDSVPPPPDALGPVSPSRPDDQSTEAYYRSMLSEPVCIACHRLGTWMGFGFEHYDPIGRYRKDEGGLPIDSTATVVLGNSSTDYADAPEMLRALATTEEAERCFAQQWLAFLLGRQPADATRTFTALELVPSSCPQAVGEPVPCTEPVTVASNAERALDCAVDGDDQLNLRELVVALASSETLTSRSFACGPQRCVAGVEYCFEYRQGPDAGVGGESTCYPYESNESGCDTTYGSVSNCSCDVQAGGATVVCRDP